MRRSLQLAGAILFALAIAITCSLLAPGMPRAPSATATPVAPTGTAQITATPAPTRTPRPTSLPITPIAAPPPGYYLFIELRIDVGGTGRLPQMMIDFPTYDFDPSSGTLKPVYLRAGFALAPEEWGFFGCDRTRSGAAGGGEASGVTVIERLPVTGTIGILTGGGLDGLGTWRMAPMDLVAVADDGSAELNIDGARVVLAPGGYWEHYATAPVSTTQFNGTYQVTQRVINYGWHDRRSIVPPAPQIMKTTDGGSTWFAVYASEYPLGLASISCPTGQICLTVDPVYRTTDGGANWTELEDPLQNGLQRVLCPGPDTCYALLPEHLSTGILVTTDAGQHWDETYLDTDEQPQAISCPSLATCFAAGPGGRIFATTDGGKTWPMLAEGSTTQITGISCPTASICAAVGDYAVLTTTDGGLSWSRSVPTSTATLSDISCPSESRCLIAAMKDFVLHTSDGGRTWQASQLPLHTLDRLGKQRISCMTEYRCVLVDGDRIWVTADGGRTWTYPDYEKHEHQRFVDVSCPDASTCFVAGS